MQYIIHTTSLLHPLFGYPPPLPVRTSFKYSPLPVFLARDLDRLLFVLRRKRLLRSAEIYLHAPSAQAATLFYCREFYCQCGSSRLRALPFASRTKESGKIDQPSFLISCFSIEVSSELFSLRGSCNGGRKLWIEESQSNLSLILSIIEIYSYAYVIGWAFPAQWPKVKAMLPVEHYSSQIKSGNQTRFVADGTHATATLRSWTNFPRAFRALSISKWFNLFPAATL